MVSVVIPTYNAGPQFSSLLELLSRQTLQHELIIIDSASTDGTQEIAVKWGASLHCIKKKDFNHGATRNLGLELSTSEEVIFMTQDAIPVSSTSLATLVSALDSNSTIDMAYGRQIPYDETGVFGKFARITNYPETSVIKNLDLIPKMGIKTCSCSNSFAVYRKKPTLGIGGFPEAIILGEDVSVAAKFILAGRAVAYCAEAEVYHSHDYSIVDEFKRYFDIGVFHKAQYTLLKHFSAAESEGWDYLIKELKYLIVNKHITLIPVQIIRTFAKYTGYKLGLLNQKLPNTLKRSVSMHKSFWEK